MSIRHNIIRTTLFLGKFAAVLGGLAAAPVQSSIISSGDVLPVVNVAGDADVRPADMLVGFTGTGTLTINEGSKLTSNKGFIAAQGSSSNGSVTITGPGSEWNAGSALGVGHEGTGQLVIDNGAKVAVTGDPTIDDNGFWIGTFTGASGNVTVKNNSELNAVGGTVVGLGSVGDDLSAAVATGTLSVETNSRVTLAGHLQVGFQDNTVGTLTVSGGSTVNAGTVAVGNEQGSNGTVTITGTNSLLEATDNIIIGPGGTGTVTVANGGTLVVGNGASVGQHGTLTGNGTLIVGSVAIIDGTIAPGLATGTLMIEGDSFLRETALIEIEIGGLNPGEFDVLDGTGETHLAGALTVSLFEGFTPEIGDTFDIMLASLFDGEFDNVLFPVFNGLTFDILYETDLVQLSVRAVPIPAAVWLFGSGLLGLVGIARRKKA